MTVKNALREIRAEVHVKGIYRRGNVLWFAHQRDGKRVFVSLETSDYDEAVRKALLVAETPSLAATGGFRLEVERYVGWRRDRKHWTRETAESHGAILRAFGKWAAWVPIATITSEHVLAFYEHVRANRYGEARGGEGRTADATAYHYVSVLRTFFKWAVDERLIRANPCVGLELVRVSHAPRTRFVTMDERDRLIENAPTDDLRFILYCGFHAGMRKKEIIEARPEWFDVERGFIRIHATATFTPKDKEDRTVPLTPSFIAFLRRYGLRAPFMLRDKVRHGRNRYRYDFARPYFAYLTPRGYGWVTPHVMRHTFCALLVSSGCSIYKVSKWTGDSVDVIQRHYGHLEPADEDIRLLESGGGHS